MPKQHRLIDKLYIGRLSPRVAMVSSTRADVVRPTRSAAIGTAGPAEEGHHETTHRAQSNSPRDGVDRFAGGFDLGFDCGGSRTVVPLETGASDRPIFGG